MPRFKVLFACIFILGAIGLNGSQSLFAQSWPSERITIVVPFTAGPGLDFITRVIAEKLSKALGQSVVIENRPGANGRLASQFVARSNPDGYTILAGVTSTHATSVHLVKDVGYDPVKDFTPIITSVETIGCIVVNQSVLPVNSVGELVDYAKNHPGKLSYGTSGVGSFFHLAGELFNKTTGANLVHIPYRGGVPAFTDLIGGHVPINFTQLAQVSGKSEDKQLKILALLDEKRFSGAPDLPSISEIIPSYRMPSSWNGFLGPAGLPEPIVQRLNAEINKILNSPDVRASLESNGYRVVGGTSGEFASRIRNDIEFYGRLIKAAGIQPE
jgi:tripartite-type tricarboxylate transporter receptor subunit TctC